MKNNDIYQIVVETIHDVTGLEREEIGLDADLTEDLSIDPVATFPLIMKTIDEQLDVNLPLHNSDFVAELKKCDTIADLVDLIETESEF